MDNDTRNRTIADLEGLRALSLKPKPDPMLLPTWVYEWILAERRWFDKYGYDPAAHSGLRR